MISIKVKINLIILENKLKKIKKIFIKKYKQIWKKTRILKIYLTLQRINVFKLVSLQNKYF